MAEQMRAAASEQIEEIDLRELLFLFQKNLWKILLAALAGALIVLLVCGCFIKPKYEATAKLYVVSASSDSLVNLNDLQIGSNLAHDYQELILTRPMMESVIQNLQLEDVSVASLRSSIAISNPSNTRILTITVTNTSPELAAEIANEVADLSLTWLPEIMEINAPNIAEEAVVPTSPSSPHTLRNTMVGALGGGCLMYAFYVVLFLMDDTIKTPEQMEKYFDTVPLASVPLDKSAVKVKDKISIGHSRGARK